MLQSNKYMKKFLILITIALLLTVLQMQPVLAAKSDGYIHNNHYYAVSFDGEGDAVVRAIIDIENTSDAPLKWITIEVPGQITVYKAVQERPFFMRADYEKTLTSNTTLLDIELPQAIEKQNTGRIVLFYKISKYAKKDAFGNFEFDFKTIIDNEAILIENVRVAVNVEPGITLKGGKSEVDYRNNFNFLSVSEMAAVGSADISSQEYRKYSSGIEYATGLVETARNLDAFESFHVKGNYGENSIVLYFWETLLGVLLLGGIIGLLIVAGKKVLGGTKGKETKTKENKIYRKYAETIIASAGSAISMVIITAGSWALAEFINSISYQFSSIGFLVMLFGAIVSAGILFMVPIIISSKKGALHGVACFFMTLAILVGIAIALIILVALLAPKPIY